MPKYLVNTKSETLWIAWLAALVVLIDAVMLAAGVDATLITAISGFVAITGRLLTGTLLPTPSPMEAVQGTVALVNSKQPEGAPIAVVTPVDPPGAVTVTPNNRPTP